MRSRSQAVDHEAAVARRLELLTHELAAVRDDSPDGPTRWTGRPPRPIRAVPDPARVSELLSETLGLGPEPAEPEPAPEPAAPLVPVLPGRHASRRTTRAGRGWSDLVPTPLRGRVWLGPGQVVVVAVLMVLGLVATCWFLVRSDDNEVAAPVSIQTPAEGLVGSEGTLAAEPEASAASGGAAVPAGADSEVVVDVTGKVRRPGIAVLKQGARVVDALKAAGGARHGVDLSGLNLAQVLTDGEQIVVGRAAPPPGSVGSSGSAPTTTTSLVNLNTADQTALESLPEVGPVTAQAILAWRTEHGGFSAVSQLLDVDGIGDATLAQITPFVTL